jgi:hypothetical protein
MRGAAPDREHGRMDKPRDTGSGRTGIRASDAEREAVADRLRAAATEGRLTISEMDDRLAEVYAATLRAQLEPLVVDLPVPPSSAPGRAGVGSGRGFPMGDQLLLVVHAVLVVAVASAMLVSWVRSGSAFFWPAFPMFWVLLSLVMHLRWRGRRRGWSR